MNPRQGGQRKSSGMVRVTESEAIDGLAALFHGRLTRLIDYRRAQFTRPEVLREHLGFTEGQVADGNSREADDLAWYVEVFSEPLWPPKCDRFSYENDTSPLWEHIEFSRDSTWINLASYVPENEQFKGFAQYIKDEKSTREIQKPWPVFGAIELVERYASLLAKAAAAEVAACVELFVESKLRVAVLSRPVLAARWLWPDKHFVRQASGNDGHAQHATTAAMMLTHCIWIPQEEEKAALQWPGEAAPMAVYEWIAKPLKKHSLCAPEEIEKLVTDARNGICAAVKVACGGIEICIPPPAIAALYLAERDVRVGQARKRIAIDANEPHHRLVSGMAALPKDTRKRLDFEKDDTGRIILMAPGTAPFQLSLPLPGEPSLQESLVLALNQWRSSEGLRTWTTLQCLFSVQGGRKGFVRWTLDEHMRAMGLSERARNNPKVRERIAKEVELLTHIELAVYSANGHERERRPLIIVGSRFEKLAGSEWKLDGMELQINPLLYSGVRSPTGRLGKNWCTVAAELAQVDDKRHPHAHALGLLVPIRQRLAMNDGQAYVTLSGHRILNMAGIQFSKRKPGEAWGRLERDLDELVRVGVLGSWRWVSNQRSMAGMLRLTPPEWVLDATVRGVQPYELPPGPQVCTGAELKAWRQARGLTQYAAAEILKVTDRALRLAESDPQKTLSTRLQTAVANT